MEKIEDLYSEEELKLMLNADKSIEQGADRVQEIINFAQNSGLKKIGIAHCISMNKQTEKLTERLTDKGFEVVSVNCRYQKFQLSDMLKCEAKGTACNPSGQAHFLDENKTELNISLGLCVGHDMIFNAKSKSPVTTLIVKDRKHKNNPYEIFNPLSEE